LSTISNTLDQRNCESQQGNLRNQQQALVSELPNPPQKLLQRGIRGVAAAQVRGTDVLRYANLRLEEKAAPATIRRAWMTACGKAGVPGLLLHDLRRSAVRNLERAGVSRSVAMKLTGPKTENVYRRDAIVAESDRREAGIKLATLQDGVRSVTVSGTTQLHRDGGTR
jgi:hypothetical protein